MSISDLGMLFQFAGGLGMFLYGMNIMADGLQRSAGSRMQHMLGVLTNNRLMGVLAGAAVTAIIQSSSATTVMVVGFVNAGIINLFQATGVIMGANIGTTITSWIVSMSEWGEVLKPEFFAPFLFFIGAFLVLFTKSHKKKEGGEIMIGFALLFIGLSFMSSSIEPYRDAPIFAQAFQTLGKNPILGVLTGLVVTAIIQSSSASVGILQTLALNGMVNWQSAIFITLGQNIGTCITAVLASIGTSRSAKRTTVIHLMFNIFGTVLFTVICMVTPLTSVMMSFAPDNPAAQIANMHTLFNIVTTLLLLPFGTLLADLAERILPEQESEEPDVMRLCYIRPDDKSKEHQIGSSAIVLTNIRSELSRMAKMAAENVESSFSAVIAQSPETLPQVEEKEEYIDFLNKEIAKYISHTIAFEANERDSALISAFFKISGNLERIGDHAMNICEYTKRIEEKKIAFSDQAKEEIAQMKEVCSAAMKLLLPMEEMDVSALSEAAALEQKIDDLTLMFRQNQFKRMQKGICSDEACILYSEMLTDFERIGDHILNIGQELALSSPE